MGFKMLKTIRYVALVLFATVTLSACQTSGVSGELKNYNSVSDYPRPTVSQVYETNFKVNQQSNAKQRRLYVDLINASTGKEGYAPRYYVMSTDKDDTTLVAVSASKRYLENIYQARAGLSRFGASARLLPLFEGHKEAGDYSKRYRQL